MIKLTRPEAGEPLRLDLHSKRRAAELFYLRAKQQRGQKRFSQELPEIPWF